MHWATAVAREHSAISQSCQSLLQSIHKLQAAPTPCSTLTPTPTLRAQACFMVLIVIGASWGQAGASALPCMHAQVKLERVPYHACMPRSSWSKCSKLKDLVWGQGIHAC